MPSLRFEKKRISALSSEKLRTSNNHILIKLSILFINNPFLKFYEKNPLYSRFILIIFYFRFLK